MVVSIDRDYRVSYHVRILRISKVNEIIQVIINHQGQDAKERKFEEVWTALGRPL